MALPPDTGESFVREVDENLRRDQLQDSIKRHGAWIAAAVVLLLASIGGYLYWQNRQARIVAEQSEAMSAALDKVAANNPKAAEAGLAPLGNARNDVVRASALLGQAALALRQNQRARAISLFKQVAADDGLPQPFRDLATVRATATEFDQLKPDEVIARLAPLAKPDNAFFGTAGEMTAMAMLAKGDRAGAGALFARIAGTAQLPESIRSRAAQIASSLGVDASASIPGILAPPPSR